MNYKDFIAEWNNNSEFIKAFTSGSTGKPKEIFLKKSFVKESAIRTNNFFKIGKDAFLHSCISPDFIGGKMMAVRALIARSRFTWEKPSNEPLRFLESNLKFNLVAVVPSQVPFILKNLNSIPKIENLLIGGSTIHPVLRKKIAQSGLNAYESYGMTETASHIALRRITEENNPFILLPDINISLDNENCLKIKFKEELQIQTNDIAEIISPKEFFIKGRRDNIIISGGRKINPIEIENKISGLINSNYIFVGNPDEKWGEEIVLLIEGYEKEQRLSEIENGLKNLLEKWEMPKKIIFVNEFPRTPNGKIKRIKDLSSLFFSVPDKSPSFLVQNKQE